MQSVACGNGGGQHVSGCNRVSLHRITDAYGLIIIARRHYPHQETGFVKYHQLSVLPHWFPHLWPPLFWRVPKHRRPRHYLVGRIKNCSSLRNLARFCCNQHPYPRPACNALTRQPRNHKSSLPFKASISWSIVTRRIFLAAVFEY
jgi:hypothetical protein